MELIFSKIFSSPNRFWSSRRRLVPIPPVRVFPNEEIVEFFLCPFIYVRRQKPVFTKTILSLNTCTKMLFFFFQQNDCQSYSPIVRMRLVLKICFHSFRLCWCQLVHAFSIRGMKISWIFISIARTCIKECRKVELYI